ncbi:MAG: hypothetical protein ACPG5P_02295, partial [Saprospiraceae bacterium]
IVGKNEVREFLQKALEFEKSYLSPKEVFALMESRKEENLAEALDYLSRTPDMLKQAENRYLRFIQGRLNDTNAGLERLNEVAFSLEEQELLKNSTHFSTKYISFTMADEKECRNIVDLVGAFTYHYFDKKIFWTEALAQTSLNKLKEYNSHKEFSFNSDLRCDAEIYADGWWGQAIKQFNGMTLNQIMLDHTDFELANQSPFLAEFIYFLGMKNYGLKIDIFQSSPPDLTSYFWLLPNIPTTQWGDTTPVWPTCPLNYERKAKFREGDYGNWKWKSSLEVK